MYCTMHCLSISRSFSLPTLLPTGFLTFPRPNVRLPSRQKGGSSATLILPPPPIFRLNPRSPTLTAILALAILAFLRCCSTSSSSRERRLVALRGPTPASEPAAAGERGKGSPPPPPPPGDLGPPLVYPGEPGPTRRYGSSSVCTQYNNSLIRGNGSNYCTKAHQHLNG